MLVGDYGGGGCGGSGSKVDPDNHFHRRLDLQAATNCRRILQAVGNSAKGTLSVAFPVYAGDLGGDPEDAAGKCSVGSGMGVKTRERM